MLRPHGVQTLEKLISTEGVAKGYKIIIIIIISSNPI